MKVVLSVGHRKGSPGAINETTGISEFAFNKDLAEFIKCSVAFCEVEVVYRESFMGLPGKINELKPDFIIALHCNAFNESASGTETLYHWNSEKSYVLAQITQHHTVEALNLPYRGMKPKHVEDKGGYLLKNTNAPCVIGEPFFIDNDSDLTVAQCNRDALALAYIEAMREFITFLKEA